MSAEQELIKRLSAIQDLLLHGIMTDGASHKQWDMDRALFQMLGETKYNELFAELGGWDKGMPS